MIKTYVAAIFLLALFAAPMAHAQEDTAGQEETELSLITATPEEGFQLAIRLARKAVTETQPDKDVLKGLRPEYSHDPDSLIAVSHVVGVYFQTVAAANNYWRD
ncbi:MAG: hexameric tyrosine-coordinated heme protein [Desulfovibrionales bacterium]